MLGFVLESINECLCFGRLCGCGRVDTLFYWPSERSNLLQFDSADPKEVITADRVLPQPGLYGFIRVSDNVQIASVYVLGSVQPPLGHILFFPGAGATLADSFGLIKRLANLGFDVFAVNHRGVGVSAVVSPGVLPTERGIDQDTKAALTRLTELIGDDKPIAYYGYSLGAAVATQRAVADPPVALILHSPFASIRAIAVDSTGLEFPIGFVANDTWDTESRIRQVFCPLLLLHGVDDTFVRPEFSERLFTRANEPKQLTLVPSADHFNVPQVMGDAWDQAVRDQIVNAMIKAMR